MSPWANIMCCKKASRGFEKVPMRGIKRGKERNKKGKRTVVGRGIRKEEKRNQERKK